MTCDNADRSGPRQSVIKGASMPLIECVPNISEGRREWVVHALADTVSAVPGVCVLDVSTDRSHNRSVLTLAGDAGGLRMLGGILRKGGAVTPAPDVQQYGDVSKGHEGG